MLVGETKLRQLTELTTNQKLALNQLNQPSGGVNFSINATRSGTPLETGKSIEISSMIKIYGNGNLTDVPNVKKISN